LLVEDDAHLRRALGRTLSACFIVSVAADHDEAVRILDAAESMDAVVSDYVLGAGGSGDRVLAEARRLFPACVPVLMSGSRAIGKVGEEWIFVKKPIDPDVLIELLWSRLESRVTAR